MGKGMGIALPAPLYAALCPRCCGYIGVLVPFVGGPVVAALSSEGTRGGESPTVGPAIVEGVPMG